MAVTAPRTTKPTVPKRPTRGSTRAVRSVAPPPKRPTKSIVKGTPGPAVKLGNTAAAKDPRFQKVMEKLDKSVSKAKEHAPAGQKAAEAEAAAQPPVNEQLAGAQAQQVDTMKDAEMAKPNPDSFLTIVRTEIAKVMPKNLDDTQNFMKGDKADQLKGAVAGNVSQQKDEASSKLKATTDQPPDPSSAPPSPAPQPLPVETSAPPPSIGATDAVPAPKANAEVSLQAGKDEANKKLADAKLTPEQLKKANDPRFSAVLTAKSAVEKQADGAPAKYRADEQKNLAQTATQAVNDEKKGLLAMQSVQGKSSDMVKAQQLAAKAQDEADRKRVVDKIQSIFETTKQKVNEKLGSLDNEVSEMFDKGEAVALQNLKNYIDARMFEWKLQRYGGTPWGLGLFVKDLLLPLPAEVNVFYEDGRQRFLKELDDLIVNIAALVETRLKEAKEEIANGQKEISRYIQEEVPANLKAVAQGAEQEMNSRFDELRQSVDDKKNDLAQNLAQRYKDSADKADQQIKEMKDANRGLIAVLGDKLGESLKVLTDFRDRIMGMIQQGKAAVDLIVADPIGFLKNLLNAINQGLNQFVNNIWTHLKAGFFAWLFGSLAEAGIGMPSDFSLGSILKLVLQVLGLTYERIRGKAVKLIGERNVMLLEKAWELISALITGGTAALWEKMKEYLANLKEMVIDAIQEWVVTSVIKSAITKLATMFNPVGAIVQAIITIYNTVMFFIERINQILDFVQAIISSVYKIATGDITSAANWIEQALARTLPIIIGFLARLLGLSGIAEKIKGFILKIQNKVDQAVDKLIGKIVGGIGKLFGKGKTVVSKIVSWWKAKKQFEGADGEKHILSFSGEGKSAELMIASKPEAYARFIMRIKVKDNPKLEDARTKALEIAKQIDALKNRDPKEGIQDQEIVDLLEKLARQTMKLILGTPKDPPSVIEYGPLTDDGGGTSMDAKILSRRNIKGASPQDQPRIWRKARRRRGSVMVQGHLLNQHLGGPGRAYNLTPISKATNANHLHQVEASIKELVLEKGRVVEYHVKVKYQRQSSQETKGSKTKAEKIRDAREYEQKYLAKSLQVSWFILMYDGEKWVKDKAGPSDPDRSIPNELPDDDNIDVSQDT